MSVHLIRLDDRDPSITYSNDTWGLAGNGHEYMRTTSRSNRVGAYMRIPFNGTKIVIYGTIDASTIGTLPQSLITIDDSRGFVFLADQTAEVQYQQKFWESSELPPGPHLLTVSIISGSTMRAAFSFDYVEYYLADSNSTSTSSSTSQSTSPTNTPSSDASSSNTSGSSHKKSSTPVIVGVICGVLALLAIIFGVVFWLRRRRMRGMNTIPSSFGRRPPPPNERSITPFITHSRNPSNAFTSSNHDLNNSSSMSEYLSSRAAAQTPSLRNDVSGQKSSSGVDSSGQQNAGLANNTPLSPGEERRNPPPRYESYRFPRAPTTQSTES